MHKEKRRKKGRISLDFFYIYHSARQVNGDKIMICFIHNTLSMRYTSWLAFLLVESTLDGLLFEILNIVGDRFRQSHSTHDEQFFCPICGETLLECFLLLQYAYTVSNFEFWFYLGMIIFITIIQCVVHMLLVRRCSCTCGCTLDGSVISIIVFLY